MQEQMKLAERVSLTADWLRESLSERTMHRSVKESLYQASGSSEKEASPRSELNIDFVAGCDVTFLDVWKTPTLGLACIKVLSFPSMDEVSEAVSEEVISFPYIPGLLAYRELPALISAYRKLEAKFRKGSSSRVVFIVDGQGIAHYRGLGIASHFGVFTGEISIGCAKSRLCGKFEMPKEPIKPGKSASSNLGEIATSSSLIDENSGRQIGVVLRVRASQGSTSSGEKNLLYISPGHRIDFETAVSIIRSCLTKHVQPEPTRLAHNRLHKLRREALVKGVLGAK